MISRRRRTEALVESDPSVAMGLALLVEQEAEAKDLIAPHQGLVMCEVRETARNSRFNLGEALVSESRVRIRETEGLGVVLGGNGELARALAVIDAACEQPEPLDCAPQLEQAILGAEAAVARAREREERRTMTSRVSFDTMGGQDMSVQGVVK